MFGLELRPRPQRRQRHERHHQHDPGRPAEQPHRYRQVGAADDAVGLGDRREQERRAARREDRRHERRARGQPPGSLHREASLGSRASPASLFAGRPDAPQSRRGGAGAHRQHPRRGVAPVRGSGRGAVPRGPAHDEGPGTGRAARDVGGALDEPTIEQILERWRRKAPERAHRRARAGLLATRAARDPPSPELAERLGSDPRRTARSLMDELEELGYIESDDADGELWLTSKGTTC